MKQIKNLLKSRETYLLKQKNQLEKALKTAPDGFLRICPKKNQLLYYHRADPKDPNGTYISKKEVAFAHQLAQKDYNTRTLRAVTQELKAIQKYNSACPEIPIEEIYETMSPYRQPMVIPLVEPEEEFIKNWTSVEYTGKTFAANIPSLYTVQGERVRSKSEIIIADLLHHEGIPYRYEYPLYLRDYGTVYPDFTVLNVRLRKEMYWEHMGMMANPEYAEKAIQKILTYEQNGIYPGENLILTFETMSLPINQKQILQLIQHYLQ